MLFPNFYVPSVGVKFVADFERTRMSLSHLGGHEQGLATNLSALHSGGPARKTKPAQPVVPVESPRSLPLATLAGNLSPVDLLHLRGHFGIPRFEGDGLEGVQSSGDARR